MASDLVEEIGISRALERSSLSDLRIVLSTDGEYPDGMEPKTTDIVCIAKDDKGLKGGVSGITGAGVDDLKNNIWYLSRKLDGVRCLIVVDEKGKAESFSRAGKQFSTLTLIEKEIIFGKVPRYSLQYKYASP